MRSGELAIAEVNVFQLHTKNVIVTIQYSCYRKVNIEIYDLTLRYTSAGQVYVCK